MDAHRSQRIEASNRDARYIWWAHRRYVDEMNRAATNQNDSTEKKAIEPTDCTAIMEALIDQELDVRAVGRDQGQREAERRRGADVQRGIAAEAT